MIASVPVKTNDIVSQGSTLLILEAMKMQNRILSPKDATIEEIFVNGGQEVSKGQLLVRLKVAELLFEKCI
jgi:biotin carboxyl carrier protein